MIFERLFAEMIETIAGEFSQTQKNFLKFVLKPIYSDKLKTTLHAHSLLEHDPLQVAVKDSIERRLRMELNLLPPNPTAEESSKINELQAKYREKWKALALNKGIH
jgi:hypothetical protein